MNFLPETKWNSDEEKLQMVMAIELALEESFMQWDLENIYSLLRAYRRQTAPKFSEKSQEDLTNQLKKISTKLEDYRRTKKEIDKKIFYDSAEDLFLKISNALKQAGVYYREGKNASHAILER